MNKNNKINIIIIDDHRLFNDGLQLMLQASDEVNIIAQIYDSREALVKVVQLKPDVILMDFNMPHLNGIELSKQLLDHNPEYKIIVLSMYNEERYIEKFRKSGIKGYLFKTTSSEDVLKAIVNVHNGQHHFPEPSSSNVHTNDDFINQMKLSNREIEILDLIKEGLTTKEIANRLNISFYTAETHRKNIKLKIGIKGEADFVKFVFERYK